MTSPLGFVQFMTPRVRDPGARTRLWSIRSTLSVSEASTVDLPGRRLLPCSPVVAPDPKSIAIKLFINGGSVSLRQAGHDCRGRMTEINWSRRLATALRVLVTSLGGDIVGCGTMLVTDVGDRPIVKRAAAACNDRSTISGKAVTA